MPSIIAGAGLALGLHARERRPSRRAVAAIAIGGLVLIGATAAYVVVGVDKLG